MLHRFRDKCVFAFYTEIQSDFGGNLPVDSADTLRVNNFIEIALVSSVSEVKSFLRFTQKFMMADKSGGKTIFGKRPQ